MMVPLARDGAAGVCGVVLVERGVVFEQLYDPSWCNCDLSRILKPLWAGT